jgi:hypothetical protein
VKLGNQPLVYFIQSADSKIKIGYTNTFSRRFTALRAGNSAGITLLGVIISTGASTLAKKIRMQFQKQQAHDDWYNATEDLLAYIHTATTPPTTQESEKVAYNANLDQLLTATPVLEALLTIKDLAKHWNVSVVTIRREIKRLGLRGIRVRCQQRFDRQVLAQHFRELQFAEVGNECL